MLYRQITRGTLLLLFLMMCAMGGLALVNQVTEASLADPLVTPTPQPGVFRAYLSQARPIIDGDLGDWPLLDGIWLSAQTASTQYGAIDDDADASVFCRARWDADYLYVGCQVSDDVLMADSGSDIWRDDSVELALDGANDDMSFCGGFFCSDDHKYEVRVDGAVTDDTRPPDPPVTGAARTYPNGYGIELAIPRANLGPAAFEAGRVLGFNLGLTDDDDGGSSEGHLIWMGDTTWGGASQYGDLILAPDPGGATATPTPTPTTTPTATPIPSLDLESAEPLNCDQVISGSTVGASSRVTSYGCVPYWPEPGPERVYAVTLAEATGIDAVLDNLSADLDLFLLTGDDPTTCTAYGDNAVSAELEPGTYYLVIDGYEGAAGTYTLRLWCPLDPDPGPSPTPTATPTLGPPLPHVYLPVMLVE